MLGFLIGLMTGALSYRLISISLENNDVMPCADMESDKTIIYTTVKRYIMLCTANGIIYLIFCNQYYEDARLKMVLYCASFTLLLMLSVIDWLTYDIPLWINICIFVLGGIRLVTDYRHWHTYIIGFFVVSGFLYLLYWWSDGSWIGGGDVKLMAAAGLLLGWKLILVAFVAGCVLGSVIHTTIMAMNKGERMLAFGPYLALGIVVSMIWGEQLAGWYLSLIVV